MVHAGSASACVCSPETLTLQYGATRGTDAGAKLWHRAFGAADWTPVSCAKGHRFPLCMLREGVMATYQLQVPLQKTMHTRCCIHLSVLARAVSLSRRSLSRGQGREEVTVMYFASQPFFRHTIHISWPTSWTVCNLSLVSLVHYRSCIRCPGCPQPVYVVTGHGHEHYLR
jgi:hypothetical protein